MSLNDAHAFAFSLAATLMAVARWEPRVNLAGAEISVQPSGAGVNVLLRAEVNGAAETFIIGI